MLCGSFTPLILVSAVPDMGPAILRHPQLTLTNDAKEYSELLNVYPAPELAVLIQSNHPVSPRDDDNI